MENFPVVLTVPVGFDGFWVTVTMERVEGWTLGKVQIGHILHIHVVHWS